MIDTVRGVVLIVFIAILAGIIAYVGDRVGHHVGRRRLTLFGLRPRYTSTIVAVATGMLIALTVTLSAVVISQYVQTAFFHLNSLNDQVNELQAKANALEHQTHDQEVVLPIYDILSLETLVLDRAMTHEEREKRLATFFDATVRGVNTAYVPPLRPYHGSSQSEPQKGMLKKLLEECELQLVQSPRILLLPITYQNLFPNDPIHFSFQVYRDVRIFAKGDVIASVRIKGGTPIAVTRAVLTALAFAAEREAKRRGMPPLGLSANEIQATRIEQELVNAHGNYRLSARAAQDMYPHTLSVPIGYGLERAP